MGFKPPETLPDFNTLLALLVNARVQVENTALYEFLSQFIKSTTKLKSNLNGRVTVTETEVDTLQTAQYATVGDESVDLPNSRQLLAGTGISFDDTVDNQRTISSTATGVRDAGYWTPLILSTGVGDAEFVITDDKAPIAVWTPTS